MKSDRYGTRPPDWIPAPYPWEGAQLAAPTPSPRQPGPSKRRAAIASLLVFAFVLSLFGGAIYSRSRSTPASPNPTAQPTLPPTRPGAASPNPPATAPTTPTTTALEAKVDPGVVDIDITSNLTGEVAAGTGLILTPDGQVLTNNHVIDGATTIVVTRVDNGQKYQATVIGTDPTADIALLQLANASGLHPVALGTSATITVGQPVVVLGNAGGTGGNPSVVTGTVQALDQTITVSDPSGTDQLTLHGLIQTNAPAQPGDSGGPMTTASGDVIGITTAASASAGFGRGASPEGFAIPIDAAMVIVGQIRTGTETATIHIGPRGLLGVTTSDTLSGSGALVIGVQSGSPAQVAKIAAGDSITAVDGQPVVRASTLATIIHSHRAGDHVSVTWIDAAGASHTQAVSLATGPPD